MPRGRTVEQLHHGGRIWPAGGCRGVHHLRERRGERKGVSSRRGNGGSVHGIGKQAAALYTT